MQRGNMKQKSGGEVLNAAIAAMDILHTGEFSHQPLAAGT